MVGKPEVGRVAKSLSSGPTLSPYDPEQLMRTGASSARPLGVKSKQLLTQGKVFENEILAGTQRTDNPAEEVPEPDDHAKNLIESS